jgi:hypothetical protein
MAYCRPGNQSSGYGFRGTFGPRSNVDKVCWSVVLLSRNDVFHGSDLDLYVEFESSTCSDDVLPSTSRLRVVVVDWFTTIMTPKGPA